MIGLQLTGYAAFVVASLVLGVRLLRLSRRTGQSPERWVGLAFLFGGGVGYLLWLALTVAHTAGASPPLLRGIVLVALLATLVGCLASGVATATIFRPGRRWPKALIGAVGLMTAAGWLVYLRQPLDDTGYTFWIVVLIGSSLFVWGSVEALLLARQLHRRARLGMADPQVVNRCAQWGVAQAALVTMTGVFFLGRLAYGPVAPSWVGTLAACFALLSAAAMWLGFFPPAAYRRRLAQAYGS